MGSLMLMELSRISSIRYEIAIQLRNIKTRVVIQCLLVFDTIYTEAQRQLIETFSAFARRRLPKLSRPDIDEIKNISTAILIDQKKMGANMRSTVGTATEVLTYLRLLFSRFGNPQIGPSHLFGFNHPDGMCPVCRGLGRCISVDEKRLLDMRKSLRDGAIDHPDYIVEGWNWRELIAFELFDNDLPLMDYPVEALDLLYIMDEPSVGLHAHDISRLITLLFDLRDRDNSVLVVEHNPDIIRQADWIIDMGPEGGAKGGEVLFEGPPCRITQCKRSVTGRYLVN